MLDIGRARRLIKDVLSGIDAEKWSKAVEAEIDRGVFVSIIAQDEKET